MTATRPDRSNMLIVLFPWAFLVSHGATCGPQPPCSMDNQPGKIKRVRSELLCPYDRHHTNQRTTSRQTQEETMQFKHCTLDIDAQVATLKLDHQEVLNAVSADMLGGLQEALNEVESRR